MLWKRTPIERTSWKSEGLYHWRWHHCYRKSCKGHQTWNKFLLDKTVFWYCTRLQRIFNIANQGNYKRLWIWFQEIDLGEIQELIDTIPEELTEDNLREMSASKPVHSDDKDREEAVPENQLTLDNLAKGSDYWRLLLIFLWHWRSMIWSLKVKQMVKKDWYCIETF